MSESAAVIENLTREEIYDQVWSQPMNRVAKTFGLSSADIAKVCRKLNIPTPRPGHWRRLELGLPVERLPLFPLETTDLMPHQPSPVDKVPKPKKQLTAMEQKVLDERKEENRIRVSDQLAAPHPLVEQTQRSIESVKANGEGRVKPKAKGCLDVCVAPESVDRAMRLMDALIKALEHRNYPVSVDKKEGKTWVTVDEEKIYFSLVELTDRREKELTPAQIHKRKENERMFLLFHRTEYERFPNGHFMLAIDNYSGSLRRRWSDSSSWRVEDVLNRFVTSIIRISVDVKESRIEAEERQRIWEEQAPERERLRIEAEQRRLDEERRKRQECKRGQNYLLLTAAGRWSKISRCRDRYVLSPMA